MTVLALSPHLDDAAFSAGGTLAALAAAGHDVVVATAFTRSVPRPTGFALACQTDKGIAPDRDYLALRRAEDAAACAALDAEPVWLDLPEAPHRGYGSAPELFAGARAGDAAWRDVRAALAALARARRPALVLTCQGLGRHVDHDHVVRAVAGWAAPAGVPVAWWRDAPYALRGGGTPSPALPGGVAELAVPLGDAALAAKLDACAAYASQLPYQFSRDAPGPPEAAMRARLGAHARAEGARLGAGGAAEALAAAPEAARLVAGLAR